MKQPNYKELKNAAFNKGYQWLPFQQIGRASCRERV